MLLTRPESGGSGDYSGPVSEASESQPDFVVVENWSSAFQAPMRGKWGKIPILFRRTLHQLNDHRKQMIPGLDSHSGTSDIANHDVDDQLPPA